MEHVRIEYNADESQQQASFQNATLQAAGPALAISIATYLDIPAEIVEQGQLQVGLYVAKILGHIEHIPGLKFDIQLGRSIACEREEDNYPAARLRSVSR